MAETEGDLPDRCWAYVPEEARGENGTKSARKLRLCALGSEEYDCRIIGAAKAALGPGFRGNRVQLPSSAQRAAQAKMQAAARRAGCPTDD